MWRKYLEREDSRIGGKCINWRNACSPCSLLLPEQSVSMKSPMNHSPREPPSCPVSHGQRQEHREGTQPRGNVCSFSEFKLCCSISSADLFVGQLKSSLTCTDCGYCSTVFDPFWDLSLPIAKVHAPVALLWDLPLLPSLVIDL